jgi:cytochrome b
LIVSRSVAQSRLEEFIDIPRYPEAYPTPKPNDVRVWDPFVRVSHWTIAIGFFIAYLTEDEAMTVHVSAGYVITVLILLRIVWGFFGPGHARFSDFSYALHTVIQYVRDLLLARARRYIGHSPAGGAMVFALLLFLAITVTSRMILYAEEQAAGPLAPFYTQRQVSQSGNDDADRDREEVGQGREGAEAESAFEEIHEVAANATLALVIFHILGVILASFVHRENPAGAMVTGRKRRE